MKKPKPATPVVFPGTPVAALGGTPKPKAPKVFPGTPIALLAPAPKPPPVVFPGTPVAGLRPMPPPRPKVRARKPKPKVKPRTAGLMPCVAVAVARVLGLRADQVLPYCQPGGDVISEVLEALARDGLCGDYWAAEPDLGIPGIVVGLTMDDGTHAAVTAGDGLMWSWGMAMPVLGRVDEAWWALPALEGDLMQSQQSDPLAFQRVWDTMQGGQAHVPSPAATLTQAYLAAQQQDAEEGRQDADSGDDDTGYGHMQAHADHHSRISRLEGHHHGDGKLPFPGAAAPFGSDED